MKDCKIQWGAILGLALLASFPAAAAEPDWSAGIIMGYNLGQNGQSWPSLSTPLENNNRGGFYIKNTRVQATVAFDSTFTGMFVGNVIALDPTDVYLQKSWRGYRLKAGKFRGAGLKSGSGTDEFEMTAVQRPRYARLWGAFKNTINFRDFGIQGEKDFFEGRFRNRLFIHNANGQNMTLDEPSFPAGPPTQVLGIDYAMDYRVSPYNQVGGHMGALANRQWDEFVGAHDFWEAQYWFKTNPLVDGSLYHQMDFPRFHMENEVMAMLNRTLLMPDGSAMLTWGFSTLARFDHALRWSPFLGYEFTDLSDGYYPDDALHMLKLGAVFRPSPANYAGMKFTGEYVRALEENGRNSVGNDILYAQFQMVF